MSPGLWLPSELHKVQPNGAQAGQAAWSSYRGTQLKRWATGSRVLRWELCTEQRCEMRTKKGNLPTTMFFPGSTSCSIQWCPAPVRGIAQKDDIHPPLKCNADRKTTKVLSPSSAITWMDRQTSYKSIVSDLCHHLEKQKKVKWNTKKLEFWE